MAARHRPGERHRHSRRIRLARNLAAFPFTNRASRDEKAEIEAHFQAGRRARPSSTLTYLDVNALTPLDRQFLVERQLISRELAAAEGPRGVAIGPAGKRQHHGQRGGPPPHPGHALRLRARRGLGARSTALDDLLEEQLTYAFSEQFGYLTACPTNVGTGMRVSVMLHLPALVQTKQIEKVFRALQKINLAVRGLYGEGSRASGDFYQISNQVTLGKSEHELIRDPHRRHPADHPVRAAGPPGPDEREPAGPPGPGLPRLRRAQDGAR